MSDDTTILAAERDIIGAALIDPNHVRWISEEVGPEDFLAVRHAAAWRSIVKRWTSQEPITEALVARDVEEMGLRGLTAVDLFDMRETARGFAETRAHALMVRDAARRRALGTFASRLQQAANSTMGLTEVMTMAREEFEAVKRSASTDLESITLGELLEGSDDYDWLIPSLLEREDRLMLTGQEGGGKTTFFRQITIMAAAGINPMTFERINPVRVQVVDCENTERQWRRKVRPLAIRAKMRGETDPLEAMHLAFPGRMNITSEKWLGAIHRLIDSNKPDLLAIGPLYKMAPSAMNSDDDVAPVLAALDSIRERGVALLIEAHAGHSLSGDGGKRNLRPRGSSALLGWPEMGFGLRIDSDDPTVSIIERWRGDRDERAWPERVKRGGDWPWTPVRSLDAEVADIGPWIEREEA
jgi:hypothetical protein